VNRACCVAIGWPVIGKLMVVHLIQTFLALHYLVESYPEPAESGSCSLAVFMYHKCKIIRPFMNMYPITGLLTLVFQAKILFTFVVSSVRFTSDSHLVLLLQLPRR